METYEYYVIRLNFNIFSSLEKLNDLGKSGWKLVSTQNMNEDNLRLFFIRPRLKGI